MSFEEMIVERLVAAHLSLKYEYCSSGGSAGKTKRRIGMQDSSAIYIKFKILPKVITNARTQVIPFQRLP
jgi:hypothetical protein